ncbi:transcriptional regulator GcvA [Bordetella avium]|uniref:transcriptional regulator GcvA n=1 Tax=Bordetella avium TaxID=521 RepID=UPI000E09F611|nr:transcriptional regulator GcvA [Bordetella avium]RIQ12255.1 transcriptional regulator GcvA [Bordetella avium]RIQ35973.1 transcriptional regulator GcvA [Bordetella avium]RIQ40199.1 transcriptional regulator GcvA [Bordetella avium]RIQ41638.1 transcriptional regulator GcvA [Bordetella avium]RIQ47516.1 transcriptional regulator GcvA [Bordetella avium]
MSFSRRFLPPMSGLCAFEAAARHLSFTAAAAELNLTQSAVSRQIRALEDMLGAPLFTRERQQVTLTAAGEGYALQVRQALQQIAQATLGFCANPAGGTLSLAILPTFGTRWLAPRLPGFLQSHPGITINLTTRLAPFDFQADTLDAAIHFGQPNWGGAELEQLMCETVVPACSKALRAQYGFAAPADLLNAPLLLLVSRPDAWERWFQAHGFTRQRAGGMLVDQFAIAAQAAIAGLGVALLPRFLIEEELARGELVEAVDAPIESAERYYLAWPPGRSNHPPLQAFRQWIKTQAAQYAPA